MLAIFQSDKPGIAGLRKLYGESFTTEIVLYSILDICKALNVTNAMTEDQITDASELVQREYYMLKPEDIKLCFNMVKSGKFGQTYNRIDVQVICDWLNKYLELRLETAGEMSRSENENHKKINPGDGQIIDKLNFYKNAKASFEAKQEADKTKSDKEIAFLKFKEQYYKNDNTAGIEDYYKRLEKLKNG